MKRKEKKRKEKSFNVSTRGFKARNNLGRKRTPYPCPALASMGAWGSVVDEIALLGEHTAGRDLIAQLLGCSEYIVKRIMDKEGIIHYRERDEPLIKSKRIFNSDIPRNLITHSIDGYKTSRGSIKRLDHSRSNEYFSDNKTIMLISLVNHKTGKTFDTFYTIEKNEDETAMKIMNCIQQALEAGEKIKYLQMDKVLRAVIKGLEPLGITAVTYGKTIKHPYSSRVESVYGNPSKLYYLNNGSGYGHYTPRKKKYRELLRSRNKFIDLDSNEALLLFSAYVEMYHEKKTEKLHIFENYIARKIEDTLKVTAKQAMEVNRKNEKK